MEEIYIITNPELGWDRVVGAYKNREDAVKVCVEYVEDGCDWEDYLVIHKVNLQ